MARKRQREIALAVVAIALVVTAVFRIRSATNPSAGVRPDTVAATGQQAGQKHPLTDVDLQALEAPRPEPEESIRNPFRFKPKAAPPPPSPAVRQPQQSGPDAPGVFAPAPLPRIALKFIGILNAEEDPKVGRVAILSDGRGVYHGREGDIIEGRYRILKIGVESIDLAYVDGRGRQTIRQTGQ